MSYTLSANHPTRSRARPLIALGAVAATVALLAVAAFVAGRALAPTAAPRDPIENLASIPVGVDHSPAGALAAADEYVLVEQESVEQNPAREGRLINTVDVPSSRAGDLQSAATIRSLDPAGMALWARGGRNLTLVGARRLDYYRRDTAQASAWVADVFWGPGRAPKQGWILTQTSLRWIAGRWMVTRDVSLPIAAPVPAVTPQAASSNISTAAFDRTLSGFSSPSYGATP